MPIRFARTRLLVLAAVAVSAAVPGFAQKPDLQAGGANPSDIPNHMTTKVTLPGFNLADAKLTVDGACTLAFYTDSANQIVMMINAERAVTDRDGFCNIHVKNGYGSADAWIGVSLTSEEKAQIDAADREADRQKHESFVTRSGTQWVLRFQSGSTVTYTMKPSADPGLPTFADAKGHEVKIAVSNDGKVTILGAQCWRTGTLSNNRVSDGTTKGSCSPPGPWTATMQ